MRSRRLLLLLAGAYALSLALIGLWATPVDSGVAVTDLAPVAWAADLLGLSDAQVYTLTETSANVLLFVPLGALVMLFFRHWRWWHATLVAAALSVLIELAQEVWRPERFADATDVVANTAGGAIGALIVVASRRVRR